MASLGGLVTGAYLQTYIMVLVDTSIWIDHLRNRNSNLVELLEQGDVVIHPWIIGELACGNLTNRRELLLLFRSLPSVRVATDEEVFQLMEGRKLFGKGIGWVDIHILAASLIEDIRFWTGDKRLKKIANSLKIGY